MPWKTIKDTVLENENLRNILEKQCDFSVNDTTINFQQILAESVFSAEIPSILL